MAESRGNNSGFPVTKLTLTFTIVNAGLYSTQTFTVYGLQVGQPLNVQFGAAFADGIDVVQPPWVSAANTLSVRLHNTTGGNITPAAQVTYIFGP